jgi:A/G-specific adenine glycosylase
VPELMLGYVNRLDRNVDAAQRLRAGLEITPKMVQKSLQILALASHKQGPEGRPLYQPLAFSDDLALGKNEKQLWVIANRLLPEKNLAQTMPRYTQALMDLGSSACLPRKANCLMCPVKKLCAAAQEGDPLRFPVKTRKLKRSSESIWLLCLTNSQGKVWLEKRPPKGVWASLYCFPIFGSAEALALALPQGLTCHHDASFAHVLTHKDLHLHPVRVAWNEDQQPQTCTQGSWMSMQQWHILGLPAPIRKLLDGV